MRSGNPAMSELQSIGEGMSAELASLASGMEVGVLATCLACEHEVDLVDLAVAAGEQLDVVARVLRADALLRRAAAAAASVETWLDSDDDQGEEDPLLELYLIVADYLRSS